jgi:hypothetical protein
MGAVPAQSGTSREPVADLDYVAELADLLGSDDDTERDFAFAFPTGTVPEPMIVGNTVIFNDQTQNIVINPMPEWRRVGDAVQIVITGSARPITCGWPTWVAVWCF